MNSSGERLYIRIAESFRRRIATGELEPGDRLPSIRECAEEWSCAPDTVGHAYAMLADEGLVESRTRAGTRVSSSMVRSASDPLGWARLVAKADEFLIEMLASGATPQQAETAVSLAVTRWEALKAKTEDAEKRSKRPLRLRVAGSHDLVAERLIGAVETECPGTIVSEFNGSLGGLLAMARGEAHLAFVHLWDRATETFNVPFVERILPGRDVVMLEVACRTQGLLVAPGNPRDIHSLKDLARDDIRFVNRQPGSASRIWLDHNFNVLHMHPADVAGFDDARSTHSDVALAVSTGQADAGLAAESVAREFGLDFVPLLREPYELAVPEELWDHPTVRALRKVLDSQAFTEQIASMGGYDASGTGRQTRVSGE